MARKKRTIDVPGHWSIKQSASEAGLHVNTIYKRVQRGELSCMVVGGVRYVPIAEIQAMPEMQVKRMLAAGQNQTVSR